MRAFWLKFLLTVTIWFTLLAIGWLFGLI